MRYPMVLCKLAMRRPVFAGLNVTERCNLACTFCAVWRSPAVEMSLPEVRQAIGGLRRLGIEVIGVTGGEPFLRKDLFDILCAINDQGMQCTLVTNGTIMTPQILRRFRRVEGLLQVAVSIDSLRPDMFAQLRGGADLALVLRTLDDLLQDGPRTAIKINVTLSRYNQSDVDPLLEYCQERQIHMSVFPAMYGRGFQHRGLGERPDPQPSERLALRTTFLRLAALKRQGALLWELPEFYELAADFVSGVPIGPCDAGRLFLDVRSDGSIAPCLDQPAYAHLLDPSRVPANLEALRVLRAAVEPALRRCSRETPCCYTCTYNLTTIASHLPGYVADFGRTLLNRTMRHGGRCRD